MKKFIKILACLALACCMLIPLAGCGENTADIKDYSEEIAELQQQIKDLENKNNSLQSEMNSLKNAKIAELEALLAQLQSENASMSSENSSLQAKIKSLQDEINELKNQNDLFTGSPKFNYSITETIPYYVNGTKIFDFKITEFYYYTSSEGITFYYTVTFSPGYSYKLESVFSATLFDPTTEEIWTPSYNNPNHISFRDGSNTKKQIILYFNSTPFASITATPTIK